MKNNAIACVVGLLLQSSKTPVRLYSFLSGLPYNIVEQRIPSSTHTSVAMGYLVSWRLGVSCASDARGGKWLLVPFQQLLLVLLVFILSGCFLFPDDLPAPQKHFEQPISAVFQPAREV